jgi:hypothetical protein
VTLPVECREKHGYVLVDLQHIVRNIHLISVMLGLHVELPPS